MIVQSLSSHLTCGVCRHQATEAAGVDAEHGKLALLINPQWQPGQVISDFGFGAKRRDCEKFLTAFQDVYYLRQQRISGDEIL